MTDEEKREARAEKKDYFENKKTILDIAKMADLTKKDHAILLIKLGIGDPYDQNLNLTDPMIKSRWKVIVAKLISAYWMGDVDDWHHHIPADSEMPEYKEHNIDECFADALNSGKVKITYDSIKGKWIPVG